IMIPVLDPDGANASYYHRITSSFYAFEESAESVQYAIFFKQWKNLGRTVELVINLHNVESAEGTHVFSPATSTTGTIYANDFHICLAEAISDTVFDIAPLNQ